MMKDQHPLDDWLRRKLAEREPAWDEAYWQQAQALIDANQQSRKRRRLLFWIWTLGLIGGIAISLGLLELLAPPVFSDLARAEEPFTIEASASVADNEAALNQATDDNNPHGINISQKKSSSSETIQSLAKSTQGVILATEERVVQRANNSSEIRNSKYVISSSQFTHYADSSQTTEAQAVSVNGFPFLLDPIPTHLLDSQAKRLPGISLTQGPRNLWAIELGSTLSPGFNHLAAAPAPWTAHPLAGIRYTYTLSPQLRLRSGLFYQGRGGLQSDSSFRSLSFSFGQKAEITTYSPRRLHYLELPLGLDIRLGNRHYLLAEGHLSWLITTSTRVSEQALSDFESPRGESRRIWGYTQGFRDWDLGVSLGYRYYLGQGLMLGAQGYLGLRDLTKNSFFQHDAHTRNLQLRLSLSYALWRH